VTGITPNSGLNTSAVGITDLAGVSFMNTGATGVVLTRAGHANITASGVTVVDNTQITCTLPITGAAAGAWNVVVINPDGQEGILPLGFTVRAPAPGPTPPTPEPTYNQYDTGSSTSDFPPSDFPLMTVTVNIGGDSKAWQAIVTGTKLSELIVTGTVRHDSGLNFTAPPGIVYQYISLVPARYSTISSAVINFTVPQSWLDENHIPPGSIVMYHQTANGWDALPTTLLNTKDGTVFFSAQSRGFSIFAIAGIPVVTTPVPVTTTGTPGSMVQEQAQVPVSEAREPFTTATTAPPAAGARPAAPSPLMAIILVIAAIGVLAAGGFFVRRWWIRRQNPALFED
jgi:PGF-pre-PGF domain-containing protein